MVAATAQPRCDACHDELEQKVDLDDLEPFPGRKNLIAKGRGFPPISPAARFPTWSGFVERIGRNCDFFVLISPSPFCGA